MFVELVQKRVAFVEVRFKLMPYIMVEKQINCFIVKTYGLKMYVLLQMQIHILNLRENIAKAIPFKAGSQRSEPLKQRVRKTTIVVVLRIRIVMVTIGK